MKKPIQINRHYFQYNNEIIKLYLLLNENGKYRWNIDRKKESGLWKNFAGSFDWEDDDKTEFEYGFQVLKQEFGNLEEIQYQECEFYFAGKDLPDFDDIINAINEKYPNIIINIK